MEEGPQCLAYLGRSQPATEQREKERPDPKPKPPDFDEDQWGPKTAKMPDPNIYPLA
jgi:hypothetical protein